MPTSAAIRASSQYKAQEKKAKMGWAKYYSLLEEDHSQQVIYSERLVEVSTKEMPEHIRRELISLLEQVKKKINCPICLDVIPTGEIDMTQCGHKFCKTCMNKLKETPQPQCSICRKRIWVSS